MTKNVFEAFGAVMADVRAIEKADENQAQRFRFRGIDAVMQAVGPALRKHGVFIVPSGQELRSETYQTKSGTSMRNVTVTVTYRVYGPGGDFFEGTSFGEAADSGDKAVTKAQSVAYRTFLLQALTVPTGDPDPDASTHERVAQPAPTTAGERAESALLAAVDKYGLDRPVVAQRFLADHGMTIRDAEAETIQAFTKLLISEQKKAG